MRTDSSATAGSTMARFRLRLSSGVRVRLRLVAMTLAALLVAHLLHGDVLASRFVSLESALAAHGLAVDAGEARSIARQRRGRSAQTIVFRATQRSTDGRGAEPADIWVAQAVVSPSGQVAALRKLHNLTRTSSADESTPVLLTDRWAMFTRSIEGKVVALELLDLAGERAPAQTGLARLRRGITNLQQSGRFRGIGKRSYLLKEPAVEVAVRAAEQHFVVNVHQEQITVDPLHERPLGGASLVDVRAHHAVVGEPLPWLVDTVREIPWIGAERIAWLENKVFGLRDQAKQVYHSVNAVDHAAEAALDLNVVERPASEMEKVERMSVPDPQSGWPPPPIEPLIDDQSVAGEGKWRPIVGDPHARALPDGSPVFFQTFLRADPQRDWARVYLTVWDPRIVQLHVVAGTEEPVSATGETGSGAIPRKPEVLGRLVGAFNGGFQAMHGEFGMMADGRVYLPPKPWAATVAVFDDGRVGMGSWPGPSDRRAGYDEARAVAEIPAGMISFRQNLTSLVEDGLFNPWGRWWWGAAPRNKSEQTLTQRSALCLTREGFMIYAWGDSASPEALGAALVSARCARAMHLDMNAGHSGMEFYNVLAPHEPREPVEPRSPSRVELTLSGLPGYVVRARKAVTSMSLALPRYIYPDPRDYFYLTLKPGLVGALLPPGAPAFDSRDLPHAGWPPAFARHLGERVRMLRIDPARAQPYASEAEPARVLLAELRGTPDEPALEDAVLYATRGRLGRTLGLGVPPPTAEVLVRGPLLGADSTAPAALGIDGDGILLYAETYDATPGVLFAAMAAVGVKTAIALPADARIGLAFSEGVLALDGQSRLPPGPALLRFMANPAPAAEVLFPDNTPMPYARWAHLQDQRVRYFRTSEPTSRAPAGVLP